MNIDDLDRLAEIDLYDILDIKKNFSKDNIKKNYRFLIKKLHPDKINGDSEAFQYVNLAYKILKNKKLRKIYNEKRSIYINGNNEFTKLKKKENYDNKLSFEESQNLFKKIEKELNNKHGFDKEFIKKLNNDNINNNLNKYKINRNEYFKKHLEETPKLNLSDDKFNNYYIRENISEGNSDIKEIIAFDQNCEIANFNAIDNYNLYSKGINTTKYSSYDTAYDLKIPKNVTNEYNSHNYISKDTKKIIRNRMENYNFETVNILNRNFNN
tara:strand:+ start:788 stop:1594 length:807 start_codon:yes stop_codon:yes gene_type:complete